MFCHKCKYLLGSKVIDDCLQLIYNVETGPSPEAVGPVPGQESGGRRLSWPVLLLTLAAVTSSSTALSLFHLLALRAEVEGLRAEVFPRREELVSQPCLQMLADRNRETFQKQFALEPHTGIPWQEGLRRGSALESECDSILVREEGYYFVYSQVSYMDRIFAMGHVVNRKKRNVVGDEAQHVTLFCCIQDMNPVYPYNTCYTGGIVKLEVVDIVELLIPRSTANISLDGDSSFLGAFRLV
ncbi:tumor necrosis factor ligand superfamily member 13B-like [Oncorhynchus masou masou]|uniref:tumor necrosis factor ligand superfamily member 13B-like n=1 Tax=Oncorhynchus masou masou TaxID=90313 RepID=UPI003183B81E